MNDRIQQAAETLRAYEKRIAAGDAGRDMPDVVGRCYPVLVRAWLDENDQTPWDHNWLSSLGCEISVVQKDGRRVSQAQFPCATMLIVDDDGDCEFETARIPKPIKTRGDVRLLCRALGIEIKEGVSC